jgi:chemotaxis protein MotA
MLAIGGLLFVIVCVFGVYAATGGNIEIVMHAAPHELATILGAAIGAFVISNSGTIVKTTLKDMAKVVKGPKWKAQDYKDVLCLMFTLCKLIKTKGVIAVESHIENPEESAIFNAYPRIQHDHFAMDLIADTLRMMTMNFENPLHVEDHINRQIEKHHHEAVKPGDALQGMADGLPALGIVAAVLGVIKTMASINEPPSVLGGMIGSALVGTFLGVFLAYGMVGPMASRLKQIYEEEQQLYFIIRDILVGHLQGSAPQVSVEVGRGNVPSHLQPNFAELEEALNNLTAN